MFQFLVSITLFFSMTSSYAALSARDAYESAVSESSRSRPQESVALFQSLRQNFPYSSYAEKALLDISNIYFENRDWVQAQYNYQLFTELYPKNPLAVDAFYKWAQSIEKQVPSLNARDLGTAREALTAYKTNLVKFPKTKYKKEIYKSMKKLAILIQSKELYVAEYYLGQKKYDSSMRRMSRFIDDYPNSPLLEKAVWVAYQSSLGRKDDFSAKQYKEQLKKMKSKYIDETVTL